jgi:hypothetical protein
MFATVRPLMMKRFVPCLAALLFFLGVGPARAAPIIEVMVGYADDIRPSPFFPSPWIANTSAPNFFFGGQDGGWDTGAIMLINRDSTPITLTSLKVDGFGDGSSFQIWNSNLPVTLQPGKYAIFAQNSGQNFDTSDDGGINSNSQPVVHLVINGTAFNLTDTAQVLNTEGTDHLGGTGLNESHAWRDIGTFGGQAGIADTPEPTSLLAFGLALAGGAIYSRYRRKRRA